MPYRIIYARPAEQHLRDLPARQRSIVLDGIERQLSHEPLVETRNRKPLRPNPLAPWELRIANMRVYYEVAQGPDPVVQILAIGIKERERVRIGGKEVEP